ncbi:Phospholipase_D-nuclease N-terminal [Micrococcales bacterium KH10]|nr:Phospholipase_D-nuclease N-terminal [Micrococcales bacterium KH10]
MRNLLILLAAALTVYAAVDCYQAPRYRHVGVPRWLWLILVIVLPVMGPIIWLVISKTAKKPGPVAPDDDPEFLRFLDERARRATTEPPISDAGNETPSTSDDSAQSPTDPPKDDPES